MSRVLTAAPSQTAEQEPDPHEEKLIAAQQQLAHEEKARRAREKLEMARQIQIEEVRSAAGLCILCGNRRSLLDRLSGRRAHLHCKVFSD